jgi:hypothetical protein
VKRKRKRRNHTCCSKACERKKKGKEGTILAVARLVKEGEEGTCCV